MIKVLLSIAEFNDEFKEMQKTLSKYCQCDICDLENFSLKDYDIFIGKKLDHSKLLVANNLKCIFAYKTGVDDFPLESLKSMNIKLVNSHANSDIIARYAFSLANSLVSNIVKYDDDLRKGIWYDLNSLYWQDIFNMKIGLLGYGHIGKAIHKILVNNNIKSYTINRGHQYENIELVDNIEELINVSDIIISSLPKIPSTNNIFNESTFKLMKGKYLVNVGRSNIIDEKALFDALSKGVLKGAAIDTWEKKPKTKNELLKPSKYDFEMLDNIIMSPHAAMKVKDGFKFYIDDITNKVITYIETNKLSDVVDLEKGY